MGPTMGALWKLQFCKKSFRWNSEPGRDGFTDSLFSDWCCFYYNNSFPQSSMEEYFVERLPFTDRCIQCYKATSSHSNRASNATQWTWDICDLDLSDLDICNLDLSDLDICNLDLSDLDICNQDLSDFFYLCDQDLSNLDLLRPRYQWPWPLSPKSPWSWTSQISVTVTS